MTSTATDDLRLARAELERCLRAQADYHERLVTLTEIVVGIQAALQAARESSAPQQMAQDVLDEGVRRIKRALLVH